MKKILVTGSNGLVGNALKKILGDSHVYHTITRVTTRFCSAYTR